MTWLTINIRNVQITQTRKQRNMENEQHPPTPMTKEQQSIWLRYLRNQVAANALRLATIIVLPATAFSIAHNTGTPPTLPVAIATAVGLILASRISF
jgi:truncated hemoglobin YjbI